VPQWLARADVCITWVADGSGRERLRIGSYLGCPQMRRGVVGPLSRGGFRSDGRRQRFEACRSDWATAILWADLAFVFWGPLTQSSRKPDGRNCFAYQNKPW
jgi:hypothetical protein